MKRKVFVSYKYADANVAPLFPYYLFDATTARNYVDAFIEQAQKNGNVVYKGEMDNEDLSGLSNTAIWERLKTKIYDSSVTVVFISPNMCIPGKADSDQWIPWEISYSLREETRKDRTSGTNALVCVILPDRNSNYDYCLSMPLFKIILDNVYNGYARLIPWEAFLKDIDGYIENAIKTREKTDLSKITKMV